MHDFVDASLRPSDFLYKNENIYDKSVFWGRRGTRKIFSRLTIDKFSFSKQKMHCVNLHVADIVFVKLRDEISDLCLSMIFILVLRRRKSWIFCFLYSRIKALMAIIRHWQTHRKIYASLIDKLPACEAVFRSIVIEFRSSIASFYIFFLFSLEEFSHVVVVN